MINAPLIGLKVTSQALSGNWVLRWASSKGCWLACLLSWFLWVAWAWSFNFFSYIHSSLLYFNSKSKVKVTHSRCTIIWRKETMGRLGGWVWLSGWLLVHISVISHHGNCPTPHLRPQKTPSSLPYLLHLLGLQKGLCLFYFHFSWCDNTPDKKWLVGERGLFPVMRPNCSPSLRESRRKNFS